MEADKHSYLEKPWVLNLDQAQEIPRKAQDYEKVIQIAFNFRFVPAVMKAKQLIEQGISGDIVNFRAQYFHTDCLNPDRPLSWRLSKE